jgi:hypothetical protein
MNYTQNRNHEQTRKSTNKNKDDSIAEAKIQSRVSRESVSDRNLVNRDFLVDQESFVK